MKFFASPKQPPVGVDLVARQSILAAIFPLLGIFVIGGIIAAVCYYQHQLPKILVYLLVAIACLAVPGLIRSAGTAFLTSNWCLAIDARGIWLNLRSYRNDRFEAAETVVFLPFDRIEGAASHKQRHERNTTDGKSTWTEHAIELYLSYADWIDIRERITAERQRYVTRKRFGCTIRGRSNHVPVSTPSEGTVRIAWRTPQDLVRPCLAQTMAVLKKYMPVSSDSGPLPARSWDTMNDLEVDEEVIALVEQGRNFDAVKLLRERKEMSLTAAKQFVDELASPTWEAAVRS